ncbi:trichothecene efflux pump [Aspergillus candidus]|uniref:Fungal trichothecene efflux pump n=1 Tax=Aspergillus candidus TaxID=41067 RepID=A0A2I2F3U2_ASPCN|nr:fungal trichothecene efflux pump [Aspergillus candidus]PLB35258.1 fungal trichothecene efflux pump [Aspergillus candidus]
MEDKELPPTQVVSRESNEPIIQNDTFAIKAEALGNDLPPNYYRSIGFIGTIFAFCMSNISQFISFILPANMLTFIGQDIGPSPNLTWVSLAYSLGLSVGFLLVGRLSDIFGRRWFFIGGNALSLIGGIVGAAAKDVETLIAADLLMGLGGSVQISFTVAVSELVPNKYRPSTIVAIFFSSFQIACFGPVISQSIVSTTSQTWRWAYYLNIICAGLAVVAFFFFYHPPTFSLLHMNRSFKQQLRRQDLVGFILFTGGLLLFIMGLSWGGLMYPWGSSHVIATIVVGFVALVLFVLYDAYVHPRIHGDPLLPTHLFRKPGYLAMVAAATGGSSVYYSMNVLAPQQVAYLFPSPSVIHAGWLTCSVGSGCLLGQIVAGWLSQYVHRSRWIMIGSCSMLVAFAAAMTTVEAGESSKWVGLMIMAMFSVGIIETCSLSLAPLSLPSEDIGAALGALGSIRSAGGSVSTAVLSTILNNKVNAIVAPAVMQEAQAQGLSVAQIKGVVEQLATGMFISVPGVDMETATQLSLVRSASAADAWRYVWYAVIAFAGLALILSFTTIDYGQYLTDEVTRKMHGRTVGVVEGEKRSGERSEESV